MTNTLAIYFALDGLRICRPNISVFGEENSPGNFLKYNCICHVHNVLLKLKYDNKLNLRYIGGHHWPIVFLHTFLVQVKPSCMSSYIVTHGRCNPQHYIGP